MSDISADSSFDLISDSDHGFLKENAPSIRRKQNASDINQATDHSDKNDLFNTNYSDAVEPNIVEAEAPDVISEQNPISPKNSTPNRRQSNYSDIVQSSEHSHNHDLQSEKTKVKLHEQKLANAEDRGFWIILLFACFVTIICFLVIGACVRLFRPPCTTVRHNASPIMKKFNVTMVNQEKVYNFPKEKPQKIMDEIERARKISEMQKNIQEVTHPLQVPKNLWNKFVPDFTKFEGVKEFLQQTQTNGTVVEEYLYYCSPRIQVEEGSLTLQFVNMDTLEIVEDFRIEDCEKFNTRCHEICWFMKNGNLFIYEKLVLNSQEYEFTRVFFIPPHELIEMY